jgi:hypothetical protein
MTDITAYSSDTEGQILAIRNIHRGASRRQEAAAVVGEGALPQNQQDIWLYNQAAQLSSRCVRLPPAYRSVCPRLCLSLCALPPVPSLLSSPLSNLIVFLIPN